MIGRHDLHPVAVRVLDKVDAHGRVLKADAAHLLVQGVRRLVVVGHKAQMALVLAQVVGLVRVVAQPGELQAPVVVLVLEEDELEALVLGLVDAGDGQAEGSW